MPEGWDEFTPRELGAVLGVAAGDAEEILGLAHTLEVHLPGTKAAFRAGIVTHDKAAIIAWATALLDPEEARAAEALVLDRAGSLTPAQLRAAIRRAVMEVNPDKARQRREHMARRTRVERWAEDSGNAGLAGRELPPAEVLAADQRVTAWAKELRKAGLEGGMDALRARAYLDILLGTDSRPLGSSPDGASARDSDGDTGGEALAAAQPVRARPDPARSAADPGPGRAGGRGDPARVRRPGHPDHPRDHPARPRGPARRAGRHRPHRPETQSKYIRLLPIPGASQPSAEGMAHVACRRASFPHEGLPRKRRGTPGMAVTRESMNFRVKRVEEGRRDGRADGTIGQVGRVGAVRVAARQPGRRRRRRCGLVRRHEGCPGQFLSSLLITLQVNTVGNDAQLIQGRLEYPLQFLFHVVAADDHPPGPSDSSHHSTSLI